MMRSGLVLPLAPALAFAVLMGAGAGIIVTTLYLGDQPPARTTLTFNPPDPPAVYVQVTIPAPVVPSPTATPAPTAAPPPPTPYPFPWCGPGVAPGTLCRPVIVVTPSPTPTFPPCSSGTTRWYFGSQVCEFDPTPTPATAGDGGFVSATVETPMTTGGTP